MIGHFWATNPRTGGRPTQKLAEEEDRGHHRWAPFRVVLIVANCISKLWILKHPRARRFLLVRLRPLQVQALRFAACSGPVRRRLLFRYATALPLGFSCRKRDLQALGFRAGLSPLEGPPVDPWRELADTHGRVSHAHSERNLIYCSAEATPLEGPRRRSRRKGYLQALGFQSDQLI